MTTTRKAAIRLLIFAIVVVLGAVFVIRALNRPVGGDQVAYTADFTNASGLRPGDDVRLLGVQIGKVTSVELEHNDGNRSSTAAVGLTVDKSRALRDTSTLAIRFQNLTGLRYLSVQSGTTSGQELRPHSRIPIDRTVPSFDITSIFNGLQPVLSAMEPKDINHLAESIATALEGDGSGLGPMIDALNTLSRFSNDRAALMETLVRNISAISDTLGGKSPQVKKIVGYLTTATSILRDSGPAMVALSDQGSELLVAADALLDGMGLHRGSNLWTGLLQPELPRLQDLVDIAALLPGIFAALTQQEVPQAASDTRCSKGQAKLPAGLQLFIKGMRVTLCNA